MKIIHTADWHLCDSLGRNDRTKDLEARVERVAALCLEHDAEVLLIAGDLFSERASVPEMTAALLHIHRVFVPFFERGGTILAITGNHDRDARINMVLAGMKLAVPVRGSGEPLPGGRLYLANSAGVVVLRSRSGQRVQFVLVPYPFASRYEISAADFPTQAEENTQIKTILADWLQKKSAEIDHALPTVLVAHLHVCGSETHSLYKITAAEDHQFQFGDLNPMWAYVALGHIHLPQMLAGAANVQYPGSLDRLDFGESHDTHTVLLLEIDGAAAVVPVRLPIAPTAFHTIDLTAPDGADIAALAALYPDRDTALVRIRIAGTADGTSRDEIARQLRKTFPRWHAIEWEQAESSATDRGRRYDSRAGFETTVRKYLADRLDGDPDAADVLALAETFLTEARTS